MLYIGAVEGSGRFLGPKHVYRMTDQQAARAESGARERYGREARAVRGARWYQDNSREAAWFVSEPDQVLVLHDGAVSLSRLAALIEEGSP